MSVNVCGITLRGTMYLIYMEEENMQQVKSSTNFKIIFTRIKGYSMMDLKLIVKNLFEHSSIYIINMNIFFNFIMSKTRFKLELDK